MDLQQNPNNASLTVRVLPAGVEPLIALAGETGKIASRSTRAEDLSEAVKDNRQKQAQLEAYAKRMDELSRRNDIGIDDLIRLAHEQASVHEQRDALRQEAAQQQRRIDTNLLTFRFSADASDKSKAIWRDFSDSLGNLLEQLLRGIANALLLLAYTLPFLIIFFPVLILGRWAWRRVFRRKAKAAPPPQ
jgi:hypothetical protein